MVDPQARLAFLLGAIFLTAGCAEAGEPELDSGPSETEGLGPAPITATSTSSPVPIVESQGPPLALQADECTGWFAIAYYPLDTGPGAAFSGWEAEAATLSKVLTYGFECARVAWGSFERPLRFVYDYHNEISSPEACSEGAGASSTWILNVLLVNDEEVAAYLANTYGLPVQVADIQSTIEAGEVSSTSWTWTVGGTTSQVTLYDDANDADQTIDPERVFWKNALGGVSVLQFDYDRLLGPQFTNRVAVGNYAEPMLNAAMSQPVVFAGDVYNQPATITGEIAIWSDMECKRPYLP